MIARHKAFLFTLGFYLLLFIPFLGHVHLFDWDEINFAEAAREMLVTGDWLNVQINYQPFWEKPPLFIWLQAISMSVFGVTEFGARFPNVAIGLVTLTILYVQVRKRYGLQASIFTLLLYIGSITPHFYFKSGIIDPLFNLFMFLSVLYLVKSIELKQIGAYFWSGLFLGAAILTKGPAALLLVGLSGLAYQLIYRINFYSFKSLLFLLVGLLVLPGLYFGAQISQSGWWFVNEFVWYQIDLFRYPIASHGQPFYYHFVVLLIGCFPLAVLALNAVVGRLKHESDHTFLRWMKVLFWVVLIVFSLVTTKIVHYSSMCYIPLAILGGVWMAKHEVLSSLQKIFMLIVGLIWLSLFVVLGLLGIDELNVIDKIKPLIADEFTLEQLKTPVDWSITPVVLALVLASLLIRAVFKYSKMNMSTLLVGNTLIISIFMVSSIGTIERVLQGEWIDQLKTYQEKPMAHFTVGFKSYAHIYYTHAQKIDEVNAIRTELQDSLVKNEGFELNQFTKKTLDNAVRDIVIRETEIPVSVSAKLNKFESMKKYEELHLVFAGNGYGVWERKPIGQ